MNRGIDRHGKIDAPPGPIEWRQADRWHMVSNCGYYTVAKALVMSSPSYGAWFRPDVGGHTVPMHLGEFPTPDDAKLAAQAHKDLNVKGA